MPGGFESCVSSPNNRIFCNVRVDWPSVPTCDIPAADVPKYRLGSGDIVFARTGATTGKSFLISYCPEAVFASYLIRVRLKPEVLPSFVYLFFQSPAYWRQIEARKRGIGQPNVNGSVLSQVQMPLPTIDEQRRIVAELETQLTRLDASVTALKRVQANFKRYRVSVLKAPAKAASSPPKQNSPVVNAAPTSPAPHSLPECLTNVVLLGVVEAHTKIPLIPRSPSCQHSLKVGFG